jgi:flavin reductase (DIM6/NTAB) family NADH-FMN oxidoreductase RutF
MANRMNAPKLYQYFANTVNLLTSCNQDGKVNVMACEWTMNVSFNPFKILCVVGIETLTHAYITESKEFGVMRKIRQVYFRVLASSHSMSNFR